MHQNQINRRIAELEAKKTLTDVEMNELISLKPGTFRKGPNLFQLGVKDVEKTFRNLESLSERSQNAFEAGYYLEAISLRLLLLDFLLRTYIVNKSGEPIKYDDKTTFGGMIKKAQKAGLQQELVGRLCDLNDTRIKGIHRLLLGDLAYDELKQGFKADPRLVKDVRDAVFSSLPLWR